jgi:phospholipid-binding lipoprotein MlaA
MKAMEGQSATRTKRLGAAVLLATCLAGAHAQTTTADPRDPFEGFNRAVYAFNDVLDRALVKPVAQAYSKVVPPVIRKGVGNFFANLGDVWSVVNNAATGRGQATGDSVGRVLVNSTIGLLGLIDVASEMDIQKHPADFGMTLGRWGVGPGPYVVLPLLGPYTLREIVALPVDRQGNLVNHVDDQNTRDGLTVLNITDIRASYLKAGDVVDAAALDSYAFTRDSYLQRQRYRQYDGEVPEEPEAPQ